MRIPPLLAVWPSILLFALGAHAAGPIRLSDIAPPGGQSIRDFTLQQTRADLRGSPHRFDFVWAVVLETGYGDGAVTVIAFADGSATLTSTQKDGYTSAGHPAAIELSEEAVRMAIDNPRWFTHTEDRGPPRAGELRIFAVGAWGLRTTPVLKLADVSLEKHRYYKLWAALHDLGQILKHEREM
jgi:hypothetical protein